VTERQRRNEAAIFPRGSLISHPFTRRVAWFAYAAVLYCTGLAFTPWLLEPALFRGGFQWLAVAAFPFVLIGFFLLGCGSAGRCDVPPDSPREDRARRTRRRPTRLC
jgi:hypothetical protein